MENLIYNDYTYNNIFKYNKDILIKYSKLSTELWKKIVNKNLCYINTPINIEELSIEEKNNRFNYQSKIYIPYLSDYNTFYNDIYTNNLNTKEILLLFKKTLLLIKDMHKNNIIHGDLYSDNIMINKELDIKLIDLDYAIIEDSTIPEDNIYYSFTYSYKKKKNIN